MTELVQAEAVEEGMVLDYTGQAAAMTLFRTDDPVAVLEEARRTADALMPEVRTRGMTANIQGKEYLTVEAWLTLGAMLGVTPVCEWTRPMENGWEARVEARTLDGRVIGAAEAECLRSESAWAKRDDYALRSMAQTRATSKALASVLRFVATLGGASGTPAEEVPREGFRNAQSAAGISPKQMDLFARLLRESGAISDEITTIAAWAENTLTGGREGSMSTAIDGLMDKGTREDTLLRLVYAAEKWTAEQSDLPAPDTRDLPDAS